MGRGDLGIANSCCRCGKLSLLLGSDLDNWLTSCCVTHGTAVVVAINRFDRPWMDL